MSLENRYKFDNEIEPNINNQPSRGFRKMPNGRPRQRNTRHANRQRQIQSVRAQAVLDEPPVVVQAEAIPAGERFSEQAVDEALREIERHHQSEVRGMEKAMDDIAKAAGVPEEEEHFGHYQLTIDHIEKVKDEKRTSQRVATQFMEKYEKAKAGTLLGFQEVELEDKDKEINDLQYMVEKLMDKCEELKRELEKSDKAGQKLMEDNQKALFLYQIVANCADEGAHIHLGKGKVIRVLSKEEAEEVRKETDGLVPEHLSRAEMLKKLAGQE